ncbi:SDR family NAD(P)-dependent oxidoreductase [Rhizobium sp. FKY42]|uniref:SDR family NAD(P)-dependent oxidoreductase n=1 Tax=Rhizobium sp. FKY42 TaxID=2562310 RepID=UPI0010C0E64C|nr:SDR family NAD(P)-dependent oxidoreductase [Rhizobium sp. FKY42]
MRSFDNGLFAEIYSDLQPIAIIGAGCRFMGASDPFTFWRRIADGEVLARRVTADDLAREGLDPALLARPDFVPVASILEDAQRFDAEWFGYSPAEAATIDPQQRLFLTCAWEALEMAGPAGTHSGQRVGVFGASRMSTHYLASRENVLQAGLSRTFQRLIGNDKDYLATRVAYKMGLTGPALTVQTACSSSLVAVHMACEQLRSGECDMALAGGAALTFPMAAGYFHQPGMIFSPDGHCRPFDAAAAGTFIGNGVAVVLLKPLQRALEDGDGVLAVIRGSAVNNDGTGKAGFTAPSFIGQKAVIAEALALSDVCANRIGFIETHGTATPLGDPIEVQALAEAFRSSGSERTQPCALGSLKANTGHLDTAAGVASLLKAAFVVKTGLIPPCTNFQSPNPALELASTPFTVPLALGRWDSDERIAGVSSFGIGGTNCHVIVEALPPRLRTPVAEKKGPVRVSLSARDPDSLRALALVHADALLDGQFDDELESYAATLDHHRTVMPHRIDIVGADAAVLARQLHEFVDQGKVTGPDLPLPETSPPRRKAFAPVCVLQGPVQTEDKAPTDRWQMLKRYMHEATVTRAAEHDWTPIAAEAAASAALHAIYTAHAFHRLGLFTETSPLSLDQVMSRGAILPTYRQLTQRLLRDLVNEGALEQVGDAFAQLVVRPLEDTHPILADMAARGYQRLTNMAARVGPKLADMLKGEVDPVSIVFPSAETDDAEEMYERQRDSIFLNSLAREAVQAFVDGLPAERPIRVFEIGAGTGGTTSSILPILPAHRTTYMFTDVGPLFLSRAKLKFSNYPFLRYATFDIEREPAEQGHHEGEYDLVIAANVLHNGRDLKRVLARARRLLAPGGLLVLREISAPKPLFDFIFGPLVPVLSDITERGGELFPPLAIWGEFLTQSGFSNWTAYPTADQLPAKIGENIILALNGEAPESEIVSPSITAQLIDTTTLCGLVEALAARSGRGFWRHEGVILRPRPLLGATHWSFERGGLALKESIDSKPPLISIVQMVQRVQPMPLLLEQGEIQEFSGLSDLLKQVFALPADASYFTASAISGTQDLPLRGKWTARKCDNGGYDILVVDPEEWPILWIENLRQIDAAEPRPLLYRWTWEHGARPHQKRRIDHVLAPKRADGSAPCTGSATLGDWQVPPSIGAGDVLALDLRFAQVHDPAHLYAYVLQTLNDARKTGAAVDIITLGALAATPWDQPHFGINAGLQGLVRVAKREHPEFDLRWIDVDQPNAITELPLAAADENILAMRRGRIFVPRLQPVEAAPQSMVKPESGLCIITGGLSPVALKTAEWLAQESAKEIWLVARRKPTAIEQTRLAALEAKGVQLTLWDDVDLCERPALERVLQTAVNSGRAISFIFHFAGHLEDTPLATTDSALLQRVFAPKVMAAQTLVDWLDRLKPGRLVFASSAATVFGQHGQIAHATANAILEGLAEQARSAGWPVQALAWGYWDDGRAERSDLARLFADQGMLGLREEEAVELLRQAQFLPDAVLMPAKIDWLKLSSAGEKVPPSLAVCTPQLRTPILQSKAEGGEKAWLRRTLAQLLAIEETNIAADADLLQLGLDSLMMLELTQAIKAQFAIDVPADTLRQNGSLQMLVDYLTRARGDHATADIDVATSIRNLLAELLSLSPQQILPDRKLLELGLDSLLFLDLRERIATEFDIRLSGETVVSLDTVDALIAAIRSQLGQAETSINPVRRALVEAAGRQSGLLLDNGDLRPRTLTHGQRVPLSPLQRSWWRGREKGRPLGGTARHLYVEYDKTLADFDLPAFESAWNQFVKRHAALRIIVGADGRAQIHSDVPTSSIERDDYRTTGREEVDRRLLATRERMSHQMFDLSCWPHFEWRASLLPEGRLRLHFDIDTTLIDIESFQVMLREIGRQMLQPERALPELSFSGADYMRSIELLDATQAAARDRTKWQEEGRKLPGPPNLPLLRRPETLPQLGLAITRQALCRDVWLRARDLAARDGLSGTVLVLSAFAAALVPHLGGKSRFALQLAYSDRKPVHAEAMNIVCEATAIMPVSFDFSEDPTFMQVMMRTAEVIREALSLELANGLWALPARLPPDFADIPHLALPVVFTSLLGVRQSYALPETADPILGMPNYEYAAQPQTALHFQVLEEERELLFNLDEIEGLFPAGLGASIMATFSEILQGAADDWARPVSGWSVIPEVEGATIGLSQWLETLHG